MRGGGGLLAWARALDNRVLGASNSKRGWLVNLLLFGMNPYLFRVWLAAAAVYALVAGIYLARGDAAHVGAAAINGCLALAWAITSRKLPARWTPSQ